MGCSTQSANGRRGAEAEAEEEEEGGALTRRVGGATARIENHRPPVFGPFATAAAAPSCHFWPPPKPPAAGFDSVPAPPLHCSAADHKSERPLSHSHCCGANGGAAPKAAPSEGCASVVGVESRERIARSAATNSRPPSERGTVVPLTAPLSPAAATALDDDADWGSAASSPPRLPFLLSPPRTTVARAPPRIAIPFRANPSSSITTDEEMCPRPTPSDPTAAPPTVVTTLLPTTAPSRCGRCRCVHAHPS